jgi:hypothetical protein
MKWACLRYPDLCLLKADVRGEAALSSTLEYSKTLKRSKNRKVTWNRPLNLSV